MTPLNVDQYLKRLATQGFRMPGEHEPQSEVWMAWPERRDNWRQGAIPAQQAFADVAKAIAAETPVVMLASSAQLAQARAALPDQIKVLEMPYNDCWMRDIGATYLVNKAGGRCGISWQFNAWGGDIDGLYSPWDLDDAVAEKMLQLTHDPMVNAPFVLEGGSIHTDGDGTLYTTQECLLHPSRNPQLSQQQIEELLKGYLGADKVIWIPRGLYNDETNGHVDNLMHVVRPGEVILTWCEDPTDPQYAISREAYEVLTTTTDAKGRAIKVHKLPLPGPLYITELEAAGIEPSDGMVRQAGERLAASYANFLITNGSVIFPLLDHATDKIAQATLAAAFPTHRIVGVNAQEILLGGGNIHCITQQVPSPLKPS
jgi:agmatine deiminase